VPVAARHIARGRSDLAGARRLYEQCLPSASVLEPLVLAWIGHMARLQGDPAARTYLDDALALSRTNDNREAESFALLSLGQLALHDGDHQRARDACEASRAIRVELGDRLGVAGWCRRWPSSPRPAETSPAPRCR